MAKFIPNPTAVNFRPSREQHFACAGPISRGGNQKPTVYNDTRAQIPCRFFQQGRCRNGDSCPFLHLKDSIVDDSVQSTRNEIDTVSSQDKVVRTISGALVHFEMGAMVESVSLPTDFSIIQISQLPRDITEHSVLDLLQSYNIDTPVESEVRVIHEKDRASALVKARDPEFAKAAARKFNLQNTSRWTQGEQPRAIPVQNPIKSDSSTLRVDCCKVHISWHKPYKTAWLNFGNEQIAKRVYNNFHDGKYKIMNQTVRCDSPTGGGTFRNPLAWTVYLTEVPASATESDVEKSISLKIDKPRKIQLGDPTYKDECDTCSAQIKSLFTSIGPLEWWEFTPDASGKRMKASARFLSEDDAREAATSLNQTPLPFNRSAKLTVQLVHMAKFKVHVKVYEAVQSQLQAKIRSWKNSHLTYVAYPNTNPPKWYRVLKLEGEGEKEVAEAQGTISRIISGVVARDGSSTLWHPALRKNGLLFEQLILIERKNRIAIIRNKVKSQLQLYGSPAACETAKDEIARLIRDESSQHFDIQLEDHELSWALRGGLKSIEKNLGSEKVILDITSTPKRITIIGTVKDYDTATSLVQGKEEARTEINIQGDQDCSVCWNTADNPVRAECGHVYCLDCFENLCFSVMTQNTVTRIACVGGSGSCSKAMGLPELQEHLSSSSFEDLLEKSLDVYVRHNLHLLGYCPTPDCGYIYRINAIPRVQMCPKCRVDVCTACQAQHGTMSCGEYKDRLTGGLEASERWKKENGIKNCPKCKTPIEKGEGCNHIACRCGAHICWVCLKTFKIPDDCYDHMRKTHNGIGLEQLQNMFD
ncbi:hypothetical protein F4811DRAFT_522245 [Daldinia bambusicola]|nr:hypothetical protein F4811DRAFT_522245 [Daldinia bambusicola]